MDLKINRFLSRTIFVDANAFIYFLTGKCNPLTVEIFKMGYIGKLKLVTTTRVVDELLFKMMVIEAKNKYGFEKNIPVKLKKNKDKVKELSKSCNKVLEFLEKSRVKIVDIKVSSLRAIPEIMTQYGLFGNNALTIKMMRELNLKFILSADRDFENIDWIEVINPKMIKIVE
ncbi:type II toxin-antitoxin system VapC family toxin [Desulfurobacterium indicum]|nr:PIN domain-containing protein [Desulfurobacterium indicum]